MAMDFFDRQDRARRQTTRLLVLFALAVVTIIAAVYVALTVAVNWAESEQAQKVIGRVMVESRHASPVGGHVSRPPGTSVIAQPTYWRPLLLLWAAVGTTLVIGGASLYKMAELSAGGETIALMLGGRTVNPQTQDLAERRLLNVVEEMALAAGMPVPPVFVLDEERGINAFAAGHEPGDAVVAVSGGCLKYLTRDELQGVIAHEFSHILNGDMRLNLRLIGVLYGILVLAIIGYYCIRTIGYVGSGSGKKSGATAGIFVVGVALVIFGYLGVFFGKVIKSAINRQREYLADASAVQFTRNPSGIAGALKKIGGLTAGSRILDGHAEEVSHMFFGDAFAGSFFNIFASHPPLDQRIRALDPEFDGQFPRVLPLTAEGDVIERPTPGRKKPLSPIPVVLPGVIPGLSRHDSSVAAYAAMALATADATSSAAAPGAGPLPPAAQVVADLPKPLLEAAREPFVAQAVVYSLLLSQDDDATRAKQLALLQGQITAPLYGHTERLSAVAQSLSAAARLPLVDLTMPALKQFSPQQYSHFRAIVNAMTDADGKLDLFEYCLRIVLFSYLDVHFGVKKSPTVRYRTINAVVQPATTVLSTLAHVGHPSSEEAERAFQAGVQSLSIQASLEPKQQCSLKAFDAALETLAQTSPGVKRRILTAVMACSFADGKLTIKEYELTRAIADALGCPVSPNLAAATAGQETA